MAVTDSFRKDVADGNVLNIRIVMKNSLLVDPTFEEFDELGKVAGGVAGLYDTHDGVALNEDKSAWNNDYMNDLMVRVVDNFSHERLKHLKDVVRHLNPVASQRQSSASGGVRSGSRLSDQEQKRRDQLDGSFISSDVVKGAVVGAVVGGVVGGVVSGTAAAVVGVVAGVVVGGTVGSKMIKK
jgi:hypothetical protein